MGILEQVKRLGRWAWFDLLGMDSSEGAHDQPDPNAEAISLARDSVARRRSILKEMGEEIPEDVVPSASMGLALSGGGIRSATISLGVVQALARHKRLLDFDYCSTVSGGGYLGSFLGSLFLPDSARGPKAVARDATPSEAREKSEFAHQALTAKVRETEIPYPSGTGRFLARNPTWWLREHSRYLAPNGTSDYLTAVTYMIRNWLAMVYVFALPVALASLLLVAGTWWLLTGGAQSWISGVTPQQLYEWLAIQPTPPQGHCGCPSDPAPVTSWFISPWIVVGIFFLVLALGACLAYWLTEYMSQGASRLRKRMGGERDLGGPPSRKSLFSSRWRFSQTLFWALLGAALTLYFGNQYVSSAVPDITAPSTQWTVLKIVMLLSAVLIGVAVAFGFRTLFRSLKFEGDAFTAEVRQELTRTSALLFGITLIVGAIAFIDTLALFVYRWIISAESGTAAIWGSLSTTLVPIIAWIINKLPEWSGNGEGKIVQLLGRRIWTIALMVGITMFALLSVFTHVGIQFLLFEGKDWLPPSPDILSTARLLFVGSLLLLLFLLTGWSTGFINLSSLHNIYASRLTRAYLGATNLERLRKSAAKDLNTSIKESDPLDQIPVDVYQRTRSAAPIHLINVTLNETKSREKSQLLERDRKGVPLVFAPEGIFLDAGRYMTPQQYFSWEELSEFGVESLSVGQLCAISGAAASSAMGSRTTLGGALALTFANIRLGYWWEVGDLIRGKVSILRNTGTWLYHRATKPFRTYFYLWNEMTADYSRSVQGGDKTSHWNAGDLLSVAA